MKPMEPTTVPLSGSYGTSSLDPSARSANMFQKGGWVVSRECGMWNIKNAENESSEVVPHKALINLLLTYWMSDQLAGMISLLRDETQNYGRNKCYRNHRRVVGSALYLDKRLVMLNSSCRRKFNLYD